MGPRRPRRRPRRRDNFFAINWRRARQNYSFQRTTVKTFLKCILRALRGNEDEKTTPLIRANWLFFWQRCAKTVVTICENGSNGDENGSNDETKTVVTMESSSLRVILTVTQTHLLEQTILTFSSFIWGKKISNLLRNWKTKAKMGTEMSILLMLGKQKN